MSWGFNWTGEVNKVTKLVIAYTPNYDLEQCAAAKVLILSELKKLTDMNQGPVVQVFVNVQANGHISTAPGTPPWRSLNIKVERIAMEV